MIYPKRMLAALLALGLAAGAALTLSVTRASADSTNVMVGVRQNMQAILMTPDGPGPYPGILVLHTSGGLQNGDTDFAARLVQAGYVALVPAFLNAYGITPRQRQDTFTVDAQPIYDDFVAALDTLRQNSKVAGGKLGAVGFSNGAYFAMWLAATGKVQAGVSYYGALSGAGSDRSLGRFREVFTRNSSPVLVLHGVADGTVPVEAAQHLVAIVTAAPSPVESQFYPGVGHRFDREADAADQAAAADAWQRTLDFLHRYLQRP